MDSYPAVEDHGLIGDLQTAALVSTDGTVDWFCAPRFDSPSVFGGLLDRRKGGYFKISPEGVEYDSKQLYLPGTPILITRFLSADGVGELMDFMPVAGERPTDCHRLIRMVRIVRGTMRFRSECRPRFNYGRDPHELDTYPDGEVFRSPGLTLTLNHVGFGETKVGPEIRHGEGGVCIFGTFHEGDYGGVVLETGSPDPPRPISTEEVRDLFVQTRDFWRRWIGRSRYTGRWRETVERSAMTLKLMTYAPTGAVIAAPTAGLPEQVGGPRNWDYRYCWIRDASLSMSALLRLGFTDEAVQYGRWLGDRLRNAREEGPPLQIMYRVDGSPDLTEEVLDHLEGYRGSAPVRIGNAAAGQLQLDIYGELLNGYYLAVDYGVEMTHRAWLRVVRMIDWLCDNWDQPEDGIWEIRGERRNFTSGRMSSWMAFDRAIRLADRYGRPADTTRWASARNRVYEQIMARGFHPGRGTFVQHYETDLLDASLLAMAGSGFVSPQGPMYLSTLQAIDAELVSDSLVYRYSPSASPDGLAGAESTFTLCTFWYVQALAHCGRLDDARLTFEKMLTYGSTVGLYSEEIAPTGHQNGNFPQAFSHLALINAAMTLDQFLDAS
ncbi:glycoside hydrolase family 15 protein [Micromonospora sp. MS34]|uniref:glycoside hydrolase family 15 protein n=1 Tax=Micromonospora sp. MS34 TaxID=3385971 RepID=UPI0039A1DED7